MDLLIGDSQDETLTWIDGDFEKKDLGVDISLGVEAPYFIGEIRYSQSIGSCFSSDSVDVTNKTVSVLAGYPF